MDSLLFTIFIASVIIGTIAEVVKKYDDYDESDI